MMYERMKDKIPGMKSKEMPEEENKKKPMAGIEIEIENEEEGMDEAGASPEGMEDEEVAVGELAKLSDEELMAEVEKRGMVVSKPEEAPASESEAAEAEAAEEVVIPPAKKKKA
jgi:hypothetical protein